MQEENAAGARPTDDRSVAEWLWKHFELVPEPQGSLTAFDGRLVLDLDASIATVDGREAQLTRSDAKLLRGLIELGEGVHEPYVIMGSVYNAWLHPHELKYPISVLRMKLGEPSWIERSENGYALRRPEREREQE
ncbi:MULTISPECIES: hypothetical protein [Streptomyces]|uniref:hypothetical protein n=1 Tax=Streptomyces TaxID=1883 RepID=UPI0004AB924B|nr:MULTISPECIES: hypothetical protein [Streptomyces]